MTEQPINGSHHQESPPQVQIPVECTPHQIPLVWNVQYNPDRREVAICFLDATGQRWLVLDADTAVRLGEDILRIAGLARTGLVIP